MALARINPGGGDAGGPANIYPGGATRTPLQPLNPQQFLHNPAPIYGHAGAPSGWGMVGATPGPLHHAILQHLTGGTVPPGFGGGPTGPPTIMPHPGPLGDPYGPPDIYGGGHIPPLLAYLHSYYNQLNQPIVA